MRKYRIDLITVAVVLLIATIWGISTSNSLVQLREDVRLKSGQVQTTLQRRSDLIPNMVETVKGYAAHEEQVFTDIAEARSKLSGAISRGDIDEISAANNELSSVLGRLLAIQEAYPELKADTLFIGMMDELAGTENRINIARQQYNDTVAVYNKRIQVFPASMIASVRGFTAERYFEADAMAQFAPQVNFN